MRVQYHMDEATFDLPAIGWMDRSVTMLAAPAPDGRSFGLIVSREPRPVDFAQAVGDRLRDQGRALRGYRLVGKRERTIGRMAALEAKITWRADEGALFHHQAFLEGADSLIVFTASASAELAEACEAWMTELLDSLRPRER
jgi:hypothetical protein